jgi:microcystin degradation protein MlrC
MRVAVAGLALESVSFLPTLVKADVMDAACMRGGEMLDGLRGTASVGGGFLAVLEAEGIEPVPVLYADASAAGSLDDAAFGAYRREIVAGLEATRPDGVLLFLHGAMTTDRRSHPDCELLRAVRETVGPRVPVMVALDLHGNLDPAMAELADGLLAFHHSPHIDMAETGERAATCLVRTLQGRIRPRAHIRKVDVVLPSIVTATGLHPLADIKAEARELQRTTPGLLDLSVLTGFAYADVHWIGFSVVAVTDDEVDPGPPLEHIAGRIEGERHALLGAERVRGLEEGVRHAVEVARGASRPVVLLEHADRLNDSTHGLRELLRQGVRRAAVPYLVDPLAAWHACRAGEGATVRLEVGGRSSERAGGPVTVEGQVLWAGEKSYIGTGPMRRGRRIDLGRSAVIDTGDIVISLITRSVAAIDRDPFDRLGLDPLDFDLVLLRSKTHFRAVWEELAQEIVIVDTPDWGPSDLRTLPYRQVRPGVFPIDRD